MIYAYTADQTVVHVGPLPSTARRQDTGQWVTPPPDGWTPELLAACGWYELTGTPRPAPVQGRVHESTVDLVDGLPVRVWTWRPWTADALAAKAAQAAYDAQRATVKAVINDLRAEKARAQTVIDTPNATINTSPAPHIKDVARAPKRIADAAIDLARFVAP